MMRWLLLCLVPFPALADAVVANRVIRAGQVIATEDLSVVEAVIPQSVTDIAAIIGKEARVALYPGRPIRAEQVGPPAIVQRNQVVSLSFVSGTLAIFTEGRALDRGGIGDVIPVVNLGSRNTVQGRIMPDGSVSVSPSEG
ncbi:flagellar basal body P-ring formation protein FlgA [Rhodobacter sp. ETT8]|uniref:Flagella basal body P-ring formation protein FlgA n=2 Tax=Pseudotabrizicola algicola TaxID=2709381 RepID=A0A6B3RMH2_9RHOB|nr:flagellar basal body P-ring formation protein FlgA [Pseudotabrizicola algicola]